MIPPAAVRRFIFPLLLVATLGCDDEGMNSPTIGTPSSVNLTGTWTGLIGTSGTGSAVRVTSWTATQTGNSVTGTVALTKANATLDFNGTLSGTLSSNRLTLTYTVPRGNVPGSDCAMSGTGTADATNSAISGTLSITYTDCSAFSVQPTTSEPLLLSK